MASTLSARNLPPLHEHHVRFGGATKKYQIDASKTRNSCKSRPGWATVVGLCPSNKPQAMASDCVSVIFVTCHAARRRGGGGGGGTFFLVLCHVSFLPEGVFFPK